MAHLIKRTSTTPATALRVSIDIPDGDGNGGFHSGGVFYFQPAGHSIDGQATGEDQHQVSREAAEIIMGDPTLRDHFTCEPPLKAAKKAEAAQPAADAPAVPDLDGTGGTADLDDAAVDQAAEDHPGGASGGKGAKGKRGKG